MKSIEISCNIVEASMKNLDSNILRDWAHNWLLVSSLGQQLETKVKFCNYFCEIACAFLLVWSGCCGFVVRSHLGGTRKLAISAGFNCSDQRSGMFHREIPRTILLYVPTNRLIFQLGLIYHNPAAEFLLIAARGRGICRFENHGHWIR